MRVGVHQWITKTTPSPALLRPNGPSGATLPSRGRVGWGTSSELYTPGLVLKKSSTICTAWASRSCTMLTLERSRSKITDSVAVFDT